MRAELLDLETVRNWRQEPDGLHRHAGRRHRRAHEAQLRPGRRPAALGHRPAEGDAGLFAALRANVDNPPKEFTDLAIRMGEGSVGLLPRHGARLGERGRRQGRRLCSRSSDAANAAVIKSLQETVAWLKKDLLPRSKGKYALGADTFARQLLYEELVDIPLDQLLAIGEANLARDQEAFRGHRQEDRPEQDARRGDEGAVRRPPDRGRPDPVGPADHREDPAVPRSTSTSSPIPSEVRPTVTETPPYARDGSFASMDTPGAYETKATEAFYYVTPTEKDWDAKHKEEHLRLFNRPVMQIITIHEAFPGHYIQFLYAKQYPTKTRKLTYCGSNVEGWAHYCEQMTVEEGYGDGDPKIRLAQLSEALLARLPIRGRHQAAHAGDDGGGGGEGLREGRLTRSRRRPTRKPAAAPTTRPTSITRWASCRSTSSAKTTARRRGRTSSWRRSTTSSCGRAGFRSS